MISLSADARIEFGAVLRLKASSRIQEILQRLGRLSQHPRPRPLTRIELSLRRPEPRGELDVGRSAMDP